MSDLVSVILPTYNRAHLLKQAIDSVLTQSYTHFELIIIDDASTDNTQAILATIHDRRMHCLRLTDNSGVAAARNIGIAVSRGNYVAFQDSDDVWHPHKLARQMAAWAEAGAKTAVLYTQFWRQKGNQRSLFPSTSASLHTDLQSSLLRQNLITTQAAMVRREPLLQAGGFDNQLPCLVDWELWLRLTAQRSFHFLAEPLVTVHFTPQSISTRETAVADALVYILQKHAALFRPKPRLLAHHHYQIGHLRLMAGERKAGFFHLRNAIHLAPSAARYWLTWSLAHLDLRTYRQIYRWKTAVVPEWY